MLVGHNQACHCHHWLCHDPQEQWHTASSFQRLSAPSGAFGWLHLQGAACLSKSTVASCIHCPTFTTCSTQNCSSQAEQLAIWSHPPGYHSSWISKACLVMHKGPPASVPIDLLSPAHVDVMCKGTWPASVSHMQYACTPGLKCAYLNPKP